MNQKLKEAWPLISGFVAGVVVYLIVRFALAIFNKTAGWMAFVVCVGLTIAMSYQIESGKDWLKKTIQNG